jgi:transcriptional regulator with XRE-family HTH domain
VYAAGVIFSEKVKRLIGDQSQAKVARRAGLSPSALNNLLQRSGSVPTAKTALQLARALEVSVDWLIDDAQDWPPPSTDQVLLEQATDDELMREVSIRYFRELKRVLEDIQRLAEFDLNAAAEWAQNASLDSPIPSSLQPAMELVNHAANIRYDYNRFDPHWWVQGRPWEDFGEKDREGMIMSRYEAEDQRAKLFERGSPSAIVATFMNLRELAQDHALPKAELDEAWSEALSRYHKIKPA